MTDEQAEAYFEELVARQQLGDADALREAMREAVAEVRQAQVMERRNRLMNLRKRVARRGFYRQAPGSGRRSGEAMGLEATLVGVNTPFEGARNSVDAHRTALEHDYVVGMVSELDRTGLMRDARSGRFDDDIAIEVAELNRDGGRPGASGNQRAARMAAIIRRYQRLSVDNLNAEGAWIGNYDGYVARTSHDPDLIREAAGQGRSLNDAFDAWRQKIEPLLDERTFDGTGGAPNRTRFLRSVFDGLVSGVHLRGDGLVGAKDPAFRGPGNLGQRLSKARLLHFRDARAWMQYHREFARGTLMESYVNSLRIAAQNTAIMARFGTNPRADFEADLRWVVERMRKDGRADAVRRFETWERGALENQFVHVSGEGYMPANRLGAQIGAGWRATQNMAKLGGAVISSTGDVFVKAGELRYHGIGLLDGYADGIASIVRGRGQGEIREIADLLRAGASGMVGSVASRFSPTDHIPGRLSKLQDTFFRLSGLQYWTDAQNVGAQLMMARHLGMQRSAAWAQVKPQSQRLLSMYGIGAREWEALRSADWNQANGRLYLTPDVIDRISAARMVEYAQASGKLGLDANEDRVARAVANARRDLRHRLIGFYHDRANFAVVRPGARERALMLRSTRPGSAEGEALRLIMQFKAFPVTMIQRTLGREFYGYGGDPGRFVGLAHMAVASVIFGYVAMSAKDLIKGRSPRDPQNPETWLAAAMQGGGAGIFGDFMFGKFNRFGQDLLTTAAGPTAGTINDVGALWASVIRGEDIGAQTLRTVLANTPFANLFWLRPAMDYLFLYQVQEALSPGYLRRMERRLERENNQRFFLPPSQNATVFGG